MRLVDVLRTIVAFIAAFFIPRRTPAPGPAPSPTPIPAPAPTVPTTGRGRLVGGVLAATIALVGAFEGLRTVAYRDPVGIPTICYGETLGVKMGDVKSVEECKTMFASRLVVFATGVEKCSELERAPDKVYIAVVSWAYNVGVGAACKSTLVKKLNAGDLIGACNELSKWTKAGGKTLPGLVKRRSEERKLCLEGVR